MAEPAVFSCAARLEEVERLAAHLRRCGAALHVDNVAMIDLELALVEAANNIVLHGYAGRGDGTIGLTVDRLGDVLIMELRDGGVPIPSSVLSAHLPPSLDAESGRGIAIIRSCIDEVGYSQEGGVNVLRLAKHLPKPPAA
ncbi:ATP-binding protein [Sphingomonas mucosissima]|uniref:Anti-sigma F factor n=1 Tax=Sphingomonas mucosissima TaxID=370959 RepID=A0A245ZJL2_9SPHN|nr:ATP-binding protein [Sphingomonas mucosissima]OWK29942.1 anti-sigma F factor [Sphingomonas mucosissima]